MQDTPITINLRYFAVLRDQRGVADEVLSTDATTPRALYQELAATYNFTLPVDRIGVAIGDEFVALDQSLKNGDNVTFIPPVAGG